MAAQRATRTQEIYQHEGRRLLAYLGDVGLAQARVEHLQGFVASLDGLASVSIALAVAAVRSLYRFGVRSGHLTSDPTRLLHPPGVRNSVPERILDESAVKAMIAAEPNLRNRAILLALYGAGLRRSEVCLLRWRDVTPRGADAGQATIFGKGGRSRTITLAPPIWSALTAIRDGAGPDDPLFMSREGGHLDPSAVHRVVKAAVLRAGLPPGTSPHWLRHSHASHSLDHGCPIHLLQQGLGHSSVATTSRYLHARPSDGSSRYLTL